MRFCGLLFPIVLSFTLTTFGQVSATPTPANNPSQQGRASPIIADSANFDRLRSIDMLIQKDRGATHPLLDPKKGLYRIPGKAEVEVLVVADPLRVKYADFLRGRNRGIVKLSAESSCISVTDVVVASEKCLAFKMPGAGAAYSFRTESYRLPRLADVILVDGVFLTGGVYQQVVMANIGDVPIEDVSLDTRGMKYLTDLVPVRDSDEYLRFDDRMTKGVEADGFLYRKGQPMKESTTFALRSIAYRGQYLRSIDGIQYDELEFDERRDVIVAFRVVDRDANGNLTIVWQRLKDVESPKLKVKR